MKRFLRRLIAAACLLGFVLPSFAAETVRIGVLAFRPKPQTQAQWQPLVGVLKRAIPDHDFVVEAFDYPELEAAIANKQLDFVLTNPGHYVLLAHRDGLSAPLATIISNENGQQLSRFGGVIFSLAQRADIRVLGDLRGKTLATIGTASLGGYQMQAYELARIGIRLPRDAKILATGMPHDLVVTAVLAGRADVGFVRSSVLENMVREGKLDLSRLKILNRQDKQVFPLQTSTRLYPEWPFSSLPHTDEGLARRVAAALFVLEEDSIATRAMGIHGFTVPADYSPVEDLLRELRLPPFEAAPAFTLQDVSARYYWQLVSAMLAAFVILLLVMSLLVTNRRLKAQRLILKSESRLRHDLLNSLGEGVYGVDHQGLCIFANPAALEMLQYTEAELVGNDQHEQFHHHHADGTPYPVKDCPIQQTLRDGQTRSGEDWFWRKDGTIFPISFTVTGNMQETGHGGTVVSFHDITKLKQADERMRHLAQHDVLTDLPNRALLSDRLQQAITEASRDGTGLALLLIDLDKFKPINDTLGHDIGDLLLQEVARRIRDCVRESDTVARVGGDEFVVLLRTIAHEPDARAVAEKIRHALNQPFELAGHSLNISSSTGIALYPEHGSSEIELSKNADIAMYHAKGNGRNNVQVFQLEMLGVQDAA